MHFTILRSYGLDFQTVHGLAVAQFLAETPTYRCALIGASQKKKQENSNHCL